MEFAPPLSNLRTQLCLVTTGYSPGIDRDAVWGEAAQDFLRKIIKLGIQVTIIGPRPPRKFGTKKTVRYMDRHEVIGMKWLHAGRSHRLEFRILNPKTQSWTRLRAEACVTVGPHGVWPAKFDGWTLPGTLTLEALARWMEEQKWVPGREFAIVGSTNQSLRWACTLLDRGAKACFVIETGDELRCWRSYRDKFLAKGGRILVRHRIQRVSQEAGNALSMYLLNEQGTLIIKCDTVVLAPANDDALNSPNDWKRGLFYVHRRTSPFDTLIDEERWLEHLDWRDIFFRVARLLGTIDHAEAEGALKNLRSERKRMIEYRRPGHRHDMLYSGKILARETLSELQSSVSVPRTFERAKPIASLECFEKIPCRACVDACPEMAIEKVRLNDLPRLFEEKCTGCGACVAACPPGAAVMVREVGVQQKASYYLPDDTRELWRAGRQMQLLNRRGDVLGTGRVVSAMSYEGAPHRIVEIESTNVHAWEARNFRILRSDFQASEAEASAASPVLLKRGWVQLNGVNRLCPVDVPITVALWQLGQRRFEDALFCHDGSCHLCEVVVNGEPALACKTLVRDGQNIVFKTKLSGGSKPLCPCKGLTEKDRDSAIEEGVPESIANEISGLGNGTCHGRWCRGSSELSCSNLEKPRPVFHGYEGSPWRDVWASDVAESDPVDEDLDDL